MRSAPTVTPTSRVPGILLLKTCSYFISKFSTGWCRSGVESLSRPGYIEIFKLCMCCFVGRPKAIPPAAPAAPQPKVRRIFSLFYAKIVVFGDGQFYRGFGGYWVFGFWDVSMYACPCQFGTDLSLVE